MATDEHDMRAVVCFLTKHQGAQPVVEQRFLVGIDDDQNAMEAVSKRSLPRSPSLVACKS